MKKSQALILALSMTAIAVAVNAYAGNSRVSNPLVDALVSKLQKTGEDDHFGEHLSKDIGFDHDMPMKADGFEAAESEDGRDHEVFLIVEKAEKPKPLCLVFKRNSKENGQLLTHFYRVSLNGKFENGFINTAKLDENGKVVRGSGVGTPLEKGSKAVKKDLQYEMDIWLKGAHRKKAAPAKK